MESHNIGKIDTPSYLSRDTDPFDWYQRYNGLKDIITQYVNSSHQILNIGWGNSSYVIRTYRVNVLRWIP